MIHRLKLSALGHVHWGRYLISNSDSTCYVNYVIVTEYKELKVKYATLLETRGSDVLDSKASVRFESERDMLRQQNADIEAKLSSVLNEKENIAVTLVVSGLRRMFKNISQTSTCVVIY